ncbi:MAG: hypothetical protein QHH02_06100 [Syntrophomonadaceae bacterium]|nr:hypothetical protein [Syntrophomonadaceae bacterium]
MYNRISRYLTQNVKLFLLILTSVTFLKALFFPNPMDIIVLFLLVLVLMGLG